MKGLRFLTHSLRLLAALALALGLLPGPAGAALAAAPAAPENTAEIEMLEKVGTPDPVIVGQPLTYTIVVDNLDTNAAQNVVVSDTLPSSVIIASATYTTNNPSAGTCLVVGQLVQCSAGNLTNKKLMRVTIVVTPTVSGVITNTASATSSNDGDPNNNSQQAVTTVLPAADLGVDLSDDPDPALVGDVLTYSAEVTNHGPEASSGGTLTATVPAGTTFHSASEGCTLDASILTCPVEALGVDDSQTLTYAVSVEASAIGFVTTTAGVSGNEADLVTGNDTASETTTINPIDLVVSKTAAEGPFLLGDLITFTLTVTNSGPAPATQLALTDTLPAELDYVSDDGGCSETDGVVTCALADLAVDDTASVTLVAQANASGVFTNTVEVSGREPEDNPADNTASLAVMVAPVADLAVSKSAAPDPVAVGGVLTYTLIITNHGPSEATGVVVTDSLPADVSVLSAPGCSGDDTEQVCAVGDLAPDGTAEVVISVMPGEAGTLTNNAVVAGNEFDPDTGNNTASAESEARVAADLEISKTAEPDPVVAGQSLTYTIVVTNTGPGEAVGVVVTDTLPAGTTFVSGTAGCAADGGEVVCDVGTLAVDATAVLELVVSTTTSEVGPLTNTAIVASDIDDLDPGDNSAEAVSDVTPVADLVLSKSADPDPAVSGEPLTYTLTVENVGGLEATNVTLTDTLPSGVDFASASAGCAEAAGEVVCALGTVAAFDTASVTIVVTPTAGGLITNSAVVAGDVDDPTPADNTAEITTPVDVANLSVTKVAQPNPVRVGERLTYTITISNAGPVTAHNVVITDSMPAGLALQGMSLGCASVGADVVCSLASLPAGAEAEFNIYVIPQPGVDDVIVNTVTATANEVDVEVDDNTDTEPVPVLEAEADLEVGKAVGPSVVAAGDSLVYTVTVTNHGPSNATGVRITDTLPSGVDFGSASAGCVFAAGQVRCDLGAVESGGSRVITVSVVPTITAIGVITNTVVVGGAENDPAPANNTAEATATVLAPIPPTAEFRLFIPLIVRSN